jgi:hypothetical protein
MGWIRDIDCPFCEHEFEWEVWENGKCPKCGEEFYWSEDCTEDYSDCWDSLWWNKWDEERRNK